VLAALLGMLYGVLAAEWDVLYGVELAEAEESLRSPVGAEAGAGAVVGRGSREEARRLEEGGVLLAPAAADAELTADGR
jgi:hypothetical protein